VLHPIQLYKNSDLDYFMQEFGCKAGKGQIKPKAHCRAIDFPNKQTNEFILFAFFLFMANKNKFVRSFFGRIYSASKLLLVLYDLWYMLTLGKTK
jgi:hypothetical protein